jgi:ribosomal protein L37AE/L43A
MVGYNFIRKILCCTIMVVIQCPHCSLEVELDDGESGLFDCPHCGEEFQWGEIDEEIDHKKPTGSDSAMSRVPRYFGIVFVVGAVLLFFPVLIALLLPVLFGIFVISMFALTPIYIERRQQRLISTARSIQRNIKEIKEYELD